MHASGPKSIARMGRGTDGGRLGLDSSVARVSAAVTGEAHVTEVMISKDTLPAQTIYVGRGSFHHWLTTTKWKSPWTPCHNCDAWDGILRYQLDVRYRPCNFAELIPRLQET